MERFNTTRTGYKYDKLIFWGFAFIMLAIVAILIGKYGVTSKPYFNCNPGGVNTSCVLWDDNVTRCSIVGRNCENPFYSNKTFRCDYVFGLIACPIENYAWLKEERLTPGVYGETDQTAGAGYLMFGLLVLAFVLNHILHNRGKAPSIDPPWARKFQKNKKFMELFDDDKELKD